MQALELSPAAALRVVMDHYTSKPSPGPRWTAAGGDRLAGSYPRGCRPRGCLSDQVSFGVEGDCLVEEPLVWLAQGLPGERDGREDGGAVGGRHFRAG
jgi:hypothetical protein